MGKKIEIKDVAVLKAIINRLYHPVLLEIIFWLAEKYGLCFTEGYRDLGRVGDVHNTDPLRAIDLRYWFYKPILAKQIEIEINDLWEYDHSRPKKKVAWIHDSGRGIHFHVQTHPNTRRR